MELRRVAVCMALFLLVVSQCSEAHSARRREIYDDYDDNSVLADEAGDEDAQNDTDVGEEANKIVKKSIIVTHPTSYTLGEGGDQRLECQVSPNNTVVSWYRNNVQYFLSRLPLHPEARYSIDPASTDLLIKNVQVSDSGTFKCEAMQEEPVSISHTLLVTKPPSVTMSESITVGEGQELRITCNVTGSPMPGVIWSLTRKGQPNQRLSEKDGEFTLNGTVYTMYIKSVKREQAGTYYCYVMNDFGNSTAGSVVDVSPKPRVHVRKTIVNSDLKIEAVLECAAHEEPRPHIRWYKDGMLIENSSSYFRISTHDAYSNLTVSPTSDDDFGTFTCVAENEFGSHNRSIELVQTPVVEDLDVEGSKISWVVLSHQPLKDMEVQLRPLNKEGESEWRRLAVPLPEGQRHKYEVTYLLQDKQLEPGEYEAMVKVQNTKNWGGSADPVTITIENGQPQFIQQSSVYRGNSATSIRPVDIVLSSTLMYLLVRML